MAKISVGEVRRVARLARLALGDEEVGRMQVQLDSILGYVAEIDALDVSGVEPTFHAVPMVAPLREDEVAASLPRGETLAAAPKTEDGGFAVPAVLESD
jgi:aspartyl-tRNA(Asn)/glutamyl-tRNA(Gln) amidotransferase subunit C